MKSRGDRNSDSPILHENDTCEKKQDQTSRQSKSNSKDGEDAVSIVPDLSHLSPEQQRIILSQTELGHDKSNPSYLDLYSFATFSERCLNVLGLFAAAGAGVCQPLMIFVFGDLITDFVNYTTALNTGNDIAGARADLTNGVKDGALYLVYIAIAMFCCTYTYMGIWTYNGEKTTRRIREQYFKAVMRQNIAWWETVGAGEITTRLTSDMATLQRGISEKVPILTQSLSCFCVAFVVAFIKDWRLAFALSAMLPVMILAGSLYFAFDSKARAAAMSKISEGSNLAEEVFAAIRTVQAYGSQNKLADLYNVSNKRAQLEANKGVLAGAICMSIYYFSFYAGYALAIFFGTILVYQGKASVGDVIACMEAVVIGALSISLIGPQTQAINGAKGASAKVLPTIWRVPPIDSASPEGKRLSVVEGELRFDNVDLYYPSRPTLKVLDNFSAVFPKGKVTALVGTSGSGKSSVIGLLERFYSPLAGTIYLDGQDIATMNVKWLRGQIGLVSQEPTLFAGSIHDNVAHGLTGTPFENEELEKKRERVIKACKVANADDFVRQMSEGYDTLVGERGLLLSGGQAQRIAIARAIIAEPPILVLDEATSALDVTSERLVQRALNQASIGRTTIAIAHRLSTIIDANQIIVMSNGQIVEQGTHASLLEDKIGVYSGLVALQSLREEKASTTAATGIEPGEEPLETMPALARAATAYSTLAAHTPASQEESGKRMGIFKVAQRVVRENEGLRWIYIIAVGGTMISGTAFPAVSILFGSLLSTFSDRPADQWQSRNNFLAGFMFLVACVTMLAILAQFYSFLYAAESVSMKLRSKLFRATVRQDICFFDETKNSTGALTSAIAHKPQQINSAAGMTTAAILQSVITLSVGLIIAFVYAWKVALVALACVPLIMAAGYTRLKVIELKDSKTEAIHESVAQMACEAAGAIKTVASLRREDAFSEIYSGALEKPMQLAYKTAILGNLFYSCGQALQFPILALVFWFGQTRMINDGLSTGDFFVALFGAIFSAIEAATIFSYVPDISGAKQGAVSAFRLLDSKPKTDLFANEGKEAGQEGHVVFKEYPTRPNVPVLRGLDLEIKPGQFVALVGPSGCGKSTTIQLMERFYDPIRGTIELDGSDIRSINLKSLRSQLALVSQTPTLFDGTVAFNITLGALDNVTQEDIEAAARLANIHDFIASLPDGYETQVGGKGGKLSGGQKQRIAIARALIRQPKVLLLDEATSALDSQSEKVVQSALDAAAKSRTTICIAHRLSTIQNADVICVFKEGRIAEKGSHDELLRRRGLYYELVQEQSLAT